MKVGDEPLSVFSGAVGKPPSQLDSANSPLVIEGANVMMVRYERVPVGGVSSDSDIQVLELAAGEAG